LASQLDTKYKFRSHTRKGGLTVEQAAKELETVRSQGGGVLLPENVVRAAQSKKSLLHGCFEWDDTAAAHEHRLDQARHLIRSVRVVYDVDGADLEAPLYVSVVQSERGYQPLAVVLVDDEATDYVVSEAKKRLRSIRKDLASIKALSDLLPRLDTIIEQLNKFRAV